MKKTLCIIALALSAVFVLLQSACGNPTKREPAEAPKSAAVVGLAVALSVEHVAAVPKFEIYEERITTDSQDVLFVYFSSDRSIGELLSADLYSNTAFKFSKSEAGEGYNLSFDLEIYLESRTASFYLLTSDGEQVSAKFFGTKSIKADSPVVANCKTTFNKNSLTVNLVYDLSTTGEYKK